MKNTHETLPVNVPGGRQGFQWSETTGRVRPVTVRDDGSREFGRWVKSARPKVPMASLA